MSGHRLTVRAERDITDIYMYTAREFGLAQADAYVGGMFDSIEKLADAPYLGRAIERRHYRCLAYESHSIFYKVEDNGVLVVRILHARMDPDRQL